MPFDPTYQYGTGIDQNSYASVPATGRRTVTGDFAILYIGGVSIGLVQKFTPTESRPVAPQFEIGNVYPVEFIPMPWSGRLQISRLEIFKNQLYQAFGFNDDVSLYGLRAFWPSDKLAPDGITPIVTTLSDIQWPINMQVHINNPIQGTSSGAAGVASTGTITVKTFIECWITEYGVSYDSGAKIVSENVSFTYRNTTYAEVPILNPSTIITPSNTASTNQALFTAPV